MSGNGRSALSTVSGPLLLGFMTVVTQTVLLRELLTEIHGNEMMLAIFLALWLVLTGAGTLSYRILGPFINRENILRSVSLLWYLMPLLQFILVRVTAETVMPHEGIQPGIHEMLITGTVALLPGCVLSGYLFPLLCDCEKPSGNPVRAIYLMEGIGMILGGLYMYTGISFAHHAVLLSAAITLAVGSTLFSTPGLLRLILTVLLFVLTIFTPPLFSQLHGTLYPHETLIHTDDSHRGRLDITTSGNQQNYYWNGTYITTSDTAQTVERNAGMIYLQHPEPQSVLIIGGVLSGYDTVFASLPGITTVRQIGIDPLIMKARHRMNNSAVPANLTYIRNDPVTFIRENTEQYDIILISVPAPRTLQLNRYYTREFIESTAHRLSRPDGITVTTLSIGPNLVLPEQTAVAGILQHTMQTVFDHTAAIPGTEMLFIGSFNTYPEDDNETLTERFESRNPGLARFTPADILSCCNTLTRSNTRTALLSSQNTVNTAMRPDAFLRSLQYNLRRYGISADRMIHLLRNNRSTMLASVIILLLLWVVITGFAAGDGLHIMNNLSIFFTSFSAFCLQVMLLYLFQTWHGGVYGLIPLFTLTFMAGLSAGFFIAMIVSLTPALPAVITGGILLWLFNTGGRHTAPAFFFFLTAVAGLLEGFMLSTLITVRARYRTVNTISFYIMDMSGAAFSGLLLSIVIIPVYRFRTALLFCLVPVLFTTLVSFIEYRRI